MRVTTKELGIRRVIYQLPTGSGESNLFQSITLPYVSILDGVMQNGEPKYRHDDGKPNRRRYRGFR